MRRLIADEGMNLTIFIKYLPPLFHNTDEVRVVKFSSPLAVYTALTETYLGVKW